MRRSLLVLALILLPSIASAQSLEQGSLVYASTTAVTVANTTNSTQIFGALVPAVTFQNFTNPQYGATDLHLRMLGTISTNTPQGAAGSVNLGCNYGGATATISLVNASLMTQGLLLSPLWLDLWIRSSNLAVPSMWGRFWVPGASVVSINGGVTTNGPGSPFTAFVQGTTSIVVPQILRCDWQWASATTANTVTFTNGILVVGD